MSRIRINKNLPCKAKYLLSDQGAVIFLFHGLVKDYNFKSIRNYTKKHLHIDMFYKILKELNNSGKCLSLDQLTYYINNNEKIPPKTFLITFDDGFYNNLSLGAPVIDELSLSFTIYLTTSFIQDNSMSWTDKLEYLLQHTKQKYVQIAEKQYSLSSNLRKKIFAHHMRKKIKSNDNMNPDEFINMLQDHLNIHNYDKFDEELDKKISWQDIKKHSSSKFITFGGHSHYHKNLNFLSQANMEYEIRHSILLLKEKANLKCKHYAYPEGDINSFSGNVIKVLQGCKIESAVTTINGVNDIDSNLHQLRRYLIA